MSKVPERKVNLIADDIDTLSTPGKRARRQGADQDGDAYDVMNSAQKPSSFVNQPSSFN